MQKKLNKISDDPKIKKTLPVFLTFSILAFGCSDNSANSINNVPAKSCENISGIEGLFWDIMNGVPRGDPVAYLQSKIREERTVIRPYRFWVFNTRLDTLLKLTQLQMRLV